MKRKFSEIYGKLQNQISEYFRDITEEMNGYKQKTSESAEYHGRSLRYCVLGALAFAVSTAGIFTAVVPLFEEGPIVYGPIGLLFSLLVGILTGALIAGHFVWLKNLMAFNGLAQHRIFNLVAVTMSIVLCLIALMAAGGSGMMHGLLWKLMPSLAAIGAFFAAFCASMSSSILRELSHKEHVASTEKMLRSGAFQFQLDGRPVDPAKIRCELRDDGNIQLSVDE